jgi:alkaline phosphatase D
MEVVYRKTSGDRTELSVGMPSNAANGAAIVEIVDLESNTRYKYEIRRDDVVNELLATGEFRTAPPLDDPVVFDYLLASCMNVRSRKGFPEQPVWDVIRAERDLDFAILAGDNVYLNDGDWTAQGGVQFDRVWYRHVLQRRETHFAHFIAKVPIFSSWDDHDYGANDSNKNQLGKNNSLYAFKNLWANPSYGTDDIPGIFYTFSRGDVQFFVMDNRYHRDNNSGSQFGTAQKEWLYDQLQRSTATFKIIVTASSQMERGFSTDVLDIGRVVDQHGISGVLFNTGDIHRNEFKKKSRMGRWPYPVTQITSSGIARVWRRPFALIHVNTQVEDPTIIVSFYGAKDDKDDTSWENDPNLSCSEEVADGDDENEQRCTEVIRLTDLTP